MFTKNQYIDLIGIQRWSARQSTASLISLIPVTVCAQAQWLFILEKQEVDLNSPLLNAILAAVGQTIQTVAIAYYDDVSQAQQRFEWLDLRYVVVMGKVPLEQLQRDQHPALLSIITGENLSTLEQDINAKRSLWQQLKLHRI